LYMDASPPNGGFGDFVATTLYFDTPLCLKALGLEGPEAERAMKQILEMAQAQKAEVACFEHSVQEIEGILEAAQATLENRGSEARGFGVADWFRTSGTTSSDVMVIVHQLRQHLNHLGISVRDTPDHTRALGVDEDRLTTLLSTGTAYSMSSEAALPRDRESLTAIHRLRGGGVPRNLEKCKALFVTSNSSLVRIARVFFDGKHHKWPVAMNDNDLAALLWLKQPQSYPDVPRIQVIADCVAALSPPRELWEAVLAQIDRLAKQKNGVEEIGILRYSQTMGQVIMEATLGDTTRVTEGVIRDVVDKTVEEIRQTAEQQTIRAMQQLVHDEAMKVARRTRNGLIVALFMLAIVCGLITFMGEGLVFRIVTGLVTAVFLLTGLFGPVGGPLKKLEERQVLWLEPRRSKRYLPTPVRRSEAPEGFSAD